MAPNLCAHTSPIRCSNPNSEHRSLLFGHYYLDKIIIAHHGSNKLYQSHILLSPQLPAVGSRSRKWVAAINTEGWNWPTLTTVYQPSFPLGAQEFKLAIPEFQNSYIRQFLPVVQLLSRYRAGFLVLPALPSSLTFFSSLFFSITS